MCTYMLESSVRLTRGTTNAAWQRSRPQPRLYNIILYYTILHYTIP